MTESGRNIEAFGGSLNIDGEISPEKDRADNPGIQEIFHRKTPAEDFEVGRLGDLEPVFRG